MQLHMSLNGRTAVFMLKFTSVRNGQDKRGRYLSTFQGAEFPENLLRNPQFSHVKLKTMLMPLFKFSE